MTTLALLAELIELTIRHPERIRFETVTYGPVLRLRVWWPTATTEVADMLSQLLAHTPVVIRRYPWLFALGDLPLTPELRSE